jgi:hypothetical protein
MRQDGAYAPMCITIFMHMGACGQIVWVNVLIDVRRGLQRRTHMACSYPPSHEISSMARDGCGAADL